MTDRLIDNFTPGDGSDGLTWAKAELTAAAVDAADAAGDRWLFDYRHSESTAGSVTLSVAGTNTTPSQLLSVTQSGASGATGPTTGAIVATGAGAYSITLHGSFYSYGITFKVGVGGSSYCAIQIGTTNQNTQIYDNCEFWLATTYSGALLFLGPQSSVNQGAVRWLSCNVKFGSAGDSISFMNCDFTWIGGAMVSGSSTPTTLFSFQGAMVRALIAGVDLSGFSSTMNLFTNSADWAGIIRLNNIVMPSGWSGSLGTPGNPGARIEAYNVAAAVASGENNFSLWIEDYAGSIKHETTIVRTGGASDGVTSIAHKISTTANAEYPGVILRGADIFVPLTSTGSKTLTVHYVADENVAAGQGAGASNAFRNDEIWLEVQYQGTTDSPVSTLSNGMCGVLTTASDNAASTETWTTTGMTTPKKGKLTATFTINEKCTAILRVVCAKASKTIYYCPKVDVS